MARVTLQTIADRVGVSRMTVSNAFSRPDQLSDALRQRILEAAKDLGYVGPDPAARALARGTTGAIGVLLTSSLRYAFTDDVAMGFLGAVAEELSPTGLAITLLSSSSRDAVVPARDAAMDGAIVYSCDPDTTAVDWLVRRGLPVVMVDQEPTEAFASVNVDDRGGARTAAQHLVDLGHRRVAVLTAAHTDAEGFVDDPKAACAGWKHAARQRMLGYLDVLDRAGIVPVVHLQRENTDEESLAAARAVLGLPERPTAVLCFSDVLASGVVRAAEEVGLRVPRDVSVVGFDDSPLAARLRPALTTVHQDVTGKGRAAAAALTLAMDAARTGTQADRRQVLLPTELVVRDSTARLS
jgi:DNA-binding LacI/PurR family transcriptional regulator